MTIEEKKILVTIEHEFVGICANFHVNASSNPHLPSSKKERRRTNTTFEELMPYHINLDQPTPRCKLKTLTLFCDIFVGKALDLVDMCYINDNLNLLTQT